MIIVIGVNMKKRKRGKRIKVHEFRVFVDNFAEKYSPVRQHLLIKAAQKRFCCSYGSALRLMNIYVNNTDKYDKEDFYTFVPNYGTVIRRHIILKEEVN